MMVLRESAKLSGIQGLERDPLDAGQIDVESDGFDGLFPVDINNTKFLLVLVRPSFQKRQLAKRRL